MNINEFVKERKEDWTRLETIAGKFKPGMVPKLSRDELWELGQLYVATVSDLSLIRSSKLASDPNNPILVYLNGLVIRVHGLIYRKQSFEFGSIIPFLVSGFPAAFRSTVIYTGVSTGVFLLFFAAGFLTGIAEPGLIELVLPDRIIDKVEGGNVWFDSLYTMAPMASSYLMTHNISVTFLVIGAGITFGVGTFYLMALNGFSLGTAAALCYNHGLSLDFWSFVLPHGSLELSAILIAGGAGFVIGHALLDPGPYRRRDFLASRGTVAAKLALGCVPMLVLAGITEAFFSPSPLPDWVKFLFAGTVFSLLIAFLTTSGLFEKETESDQAAKSNQPVR
ncbi:stage II sporulation protein M [Thermodesulfobacteriota bacterium]